MTDSASPEVTIWDDGRQVTVAWADGRVVRAPAPWLFDNAADAFDPASGHRLTGGLALAAAVRVTDARLDDGAVEARFAPGGATRRIALSALLADAEAGEAIASELWPTPGPVAAAPPIAFERYMADDGALAEALRRIVRHGIVFLSGAGTEPLAVERAVARFGLIRETNYGRLFDVREEAQPSHLAYTATGLELHTDNPYREPPPALQALHVIAAAAQGGESQFADGFAHAEALRAAAPDRFEALASTPVRFAYAGPGGERYEARAPVIETGADGSVAGVRVNHRALRALPLTCGGAAAWYEAYLDFYQRLHDPAARLERKLTPGELVMFDNRRLLHGRSAFAPGAEARWLQGCYAERDGLLATLARLSRSGPLGDAA
jgi:gamma-butyrobetaine dioxygenase